MYKTKTLIVKATRYLYDFLDNGGANGSETDDLINSGSCIVNNNTSNNNMVFI